MSGTLALGLGFLLGMRHATDADHLAAIGAMIRRGDGVRGAVRTAVLWGLGHSATVVGVGLVMVLFGVRFPPGVAHALELAVAAMLVALGVANLAALRRDAARAGETQEATPAAPRGAALRPVAVGLVHGLAGSTATTLLALGTIRSPAGAVAYLVLFGAGTVGGMIVLTAALSLPLLVAARRAHRALLVGASATSIAMGGAIAASALGVT